MNGAHAHVILNHSPIFAVVFGAIFLIAAFFRRDLCLKRCAFILFLGGAILAIAVYLTGDSAEEVVRNLPGVSAESVAAHETAGTIALAGTLLLASLTLWGLVFYHRLDKLPRLYDLIHLLMAVVVMLILMWSAYLGGRIRHPEIVRGNRVVVVDLQGVG